MICPEDVKRKAAGILWPADAGGRLHADVKEALKRILALKRGSAMVLKFSGKQPEFAEELWNAEE